jgi:hypothetical protein
MDAFFCPCAHASNFTPCIHQTSLANQITRRFGESYQERRGIHRYRMRIWRCERSVRWGRRRASRGGGYPILNVLRCRIALEGGHHWSPTNHLHHRLSWPWCKRREMDIILVWSPDGKFDHCCQAREHWHVVQYSLIVRIDVKTQPQRWNSAMFENMQTVGLHYEVF